MGNIKSNPIHTHTHNEQKLFQLCAVGAAHAAYFGGFVCCYRSGKPSPQEASKEEA